MYPLTGDIWPGLAWGAVSSLGLLVGAAAGSVFRFSHHAIAMAIALGNALDGIPEALVLGLALRAQVFPLALVLAFSVGNVPEALSSAAGMWAAGRGGAYILVMWSAIAIGSAVTIAAGYVWLAALDPAWAPRLQAFGAGALLAMIVETVIPEAFHNSPRFSGLLAATGFGALLLADATVR